MSVDSPGDGNVIADPLPDPRERRRIRRVLRAEAFRLFREQGYRETRVDQIAVAAGITAHEFSRYFPAKENLLLSDDLDAPLREALAAQPADSPPLTALRAAVTSVLTRLSAENLAFEQEREALLYHVPDLRAAVTMQFERDIDLLAGAFATHLRRDAADFEIRVAAGAVAGAALAIAKMVPVNVDNIGRALSFLEAGLPLRPQG